jgi:hypothetical protein
MLGYLIRKFVREKVRVEFKDGFDASGYLYSMNTVELPIVRFRGWWILKNQVGSERVRFHSNEVSKVALIRLVTLDLRINANKFTNEIQHALKEVQALTGTLTVMGEAEVKDGIVQDVEVDTVTLSTDFPAKFDKAFGEDPIKNIVDASYIGNGIIVSTEDQLPTL